MATYYLSPSGNDSYTTVQAQNEATPWKTFSKAFGEMSAADTLTLLNGTYSVAAGTGVISGTGTGSAMPPNGTNKAAPTIVQAQNEGSVTIDGSAAAGLRLGTTTVKRSYIKIKGITFQGGGSLYNTSYVYLKNCGFHSTNKTGGSVFGIGTNDHTNGNTYNLIEDCWIWGQERLIAANYRGDNNIWRRVIVRGDGCDSASCTGGFEVNPNVGITVYSSKNCSLQNVMCIDRILGGGTAYGDFSSAQHTEDASLYLGPNEWLGCISLNGPDCGFYFEADAANDYTWKVHNCVSWGSAASGFNSQGTQLKNIELSNFTSGNCGSGDAIRVAYVPSGIIKNIISYNSFRYGINTYDSGIILTYCDVYGSGDDAYEGNTCAVGAKTTNPLADGPPHSLKYITRIELGSALKGTGDGGDYGANVVKRYGKEGSFYGDDDYNALTAVELWPWPNEARIHTELGADSTRGFCAVGETLTHYIWNYLGGGGYPTETSKFVMVFK